MLDPLVESIQVSSDLKFAHFLTFLRLGSNIEAEGFGRGSDSDLGVFFQPALDDGKLFRLVAKWRSWARLP